MAWDTQLDMEWIKLNTLHASIYARCQTGRFVFFCLRANHSCENVKQAPFHMSGFVRGNLKMAYLNPNNVESLSFSVKFQVFCVYCMKSEFLKYHLSITVPMETSDDNFHVGISSQTLIIYCVSEEPGFPVCY